MTQLYIRLQNFIHSLRAERGQPALEYIAIAVVVVVGIIAALAMFGDDVEAEVNSLFGEIFG